MSFVTYVWDPIEDNIVMDIGDAGEILGSYSTEPGQHGDVISHAVADETTYFHYDGDGNVMAGTDSDSDIVALRAYSIFGEVTLSLGATDLKRQFRGRNGYIWEPAIGEYIVGPRSYSPISGRWLAAEAKINGADVNPYFYAVTGKLRVLDTSELISDPMRFANVLQRVAEPGDERFIAIARNEAKESEPRLTDHNRRRPVCCHFTNKKKLWSDTYTAEANETAEHACKRIAVGWGITQAWTVVSARESDCKRNPADSDEFYVCGRVIRDNGTAGVCARTCGFSHVDIYTLHEGMIRMGFGGAVDPGKGEKIPLGDKDFTCIHLIRWYKGDVACNKGACVTIVEENLSWGKAKGTPCATARDSEIIDCIRSKPVPTGDSGLRYNCQVDCAHAARGCCLSGFGAHSILNATPGGW